MYIARQPIFNKRLNVFGYELLFRDNINSKVFGGAPSTYATAAVLDGLLEVGIEKIVENKRAFVNFDYNLLLSNIIELFDPSYLVIEVLEDVKIDDLIIERIKTLKSKGYKIALDDFVESYDDYPLISMANIIKYDIIATPLNKIGSEVEKALIDRKILLAEKVETKEEYLQAKAMGFHLFQGFFFSRPSIVSKTSDKRVKRNEYFRLITELRKEEPSYQKLSEIIETNVNISYSLLKVIGNRKPENRVYSIKKALVRMGFKEIESWVNILMMRDLSSHKPRELTRLSLIRSKFGEYIAVNSNYKKRKFEISMMCLFSVIDALLDETMEEALDDVILTGDIKEALIHKTGRLSDPMQLVMAYENGQWDEANAYCEKIGMDQEKLSQGYLDAIRWTEETLATF